MSTGKPSGGNVFELKKNESTSHAREPFETKLHENILKRYDEKSLLMKNSPVEEIPAMPPSLSDENNIAQLIGYYEKHLMKNEELEVESKSNLKKLKSLPTDARENFDDFSKSQKSRKNDSPLGSSSPMSPRRTDNLSGE